MRADNHSRKAPHESRPITPLLSPVNFWICLKLLSNSYMHPPHWGVSVSHPACVECADNACYRGGVSLRGLLFVTDTKILGIMWLFGGIHPIAHDSPLRGDPTAPRNRMFRLSLTSAPLFSSLPLRLCASLPSRRTTGFS